MEATTPPQGWDTDPIFDAFGGVREQIRIFLEMLYEPEEIVEVRTLPDTYSYFMTREEFLRDYEFYLRKNREGQNIYVSVFPRLREGGKKNEDAADGHCVLTDFDKTTPEDAMRKITEVRLPKPSLAVNSGHGMHAWWKLKAATPPAKVSSLARDMARLLESDPSVCNPGRIIRVPGFYNLREPQKPCYIVEINDHQYDFDELRVLVPSGKCKQTVDVAFDELDQIPEGHRNNSLAHFAGYLRSRGLTYDEILPSLLRINETRCRPPLDPSEVERIARSISKRPGWNGLLELSGNADSFPDLRDESPYDDLANARRLADNIKDGARFCEELDEWFAFIAKYWEASYLAVELMVKKEVQRDKDLASKSKDLSSRKYLEDRYRYTSKAINFRQMISLSRSEPGIVIARREFDVDPMLLNVGNGTLELTTGRLREHRSSDYMTMHTDVPYDGTAQCPLWKSVIDWAMEEDRERAFWLQRSIGYMATGRTDEQVMFMWLGDGGNGKSTIAEALRTVLGTYTARTPTETLLQGANDGKVRDDLARLENKRLITASEIPKNRKLDEPLVKEFTGGDTIAARHLYSRYGEFRPQGKLLVLTNYKPVISGTDHGIWRRVCMPLFNATIAEDKRDPELPRKLRAESEGILKWIIEGCQMWQRDGLGKVAEFEAAVEAYRSEMDTVRVFLEACCVFLPGVRIYKTDLHLAFTRWCRSRRIVDMCSEEFGKKVLTLIRVRKIIVKSSHSDSDRYWGGMTLRNDWETAL